VWELVYKELGTVATHRCSCLEQSASTSHLLTLCGCLPVAS